MHKRTDTGDPDSLPEILAQARIGGQSLHARAQDARKLTWIIRQILPPDLAPHCLWATAEKGIMFLVTDNSSWATRLRFEESRMLDEASRIFGIKLVRVRVLIIPAGEWIAPVSAPETQA